MMISIYLFDTHLYYAHWTNLLFFFFLFFQFQFNLINVNWMITVVCVTTSLKVKTVNCMRVLCIKQMIFSYLLIERERERHIVVIFQLIIEEFCFFCSLFMSRSTKNELMHEYYLNHIAWASNHFKLINWYFFLFFFFLHIWQIVLVNGI